MTGECENEEDSVSDIDWKNKKKLKKTYEKLL